MAKGRLAYPSFRQPSEVVFGTGAVRSLASLERLSETAFFLSGSPAVRETLAAAFARRDVDLASLRTIAKPPGEPTLPMIEEAARWLHGAPPVRIVAVGGGSVLDWARLAWARAANLLGETALSDRVVPRPELVLVPTTCATGAEAASVAVYTAEGRKVPVVRREFLADRVVLDGQFLQHVGRRDLARGLCDAASHAIEGFASIVPSTLAKEAAASALDLVLRHWPGDETPSRRERLMEAAYLGGLAASNCSVGVIHAFAHSVARYGIAHGHANALGLIAGLRVNRQAPTVIELARRRGVGGADGLVAQITPLVAAAEPWEGAEALQELLGDASGRASLASAMTADVCLRSNPRTLGPAELDEFLDAVAGSLIAA